MSDTEVSIGDLLDTLAGLDSSQRREVAELLRQVSQTFAEVSDGKRPHTFWACSPSCSTQADASRKRSVSGQASVPSAPLRFPTNSVFGKYILIVIVRKGGTAVVVVH
jgi:hypothetical protein